jgi:pSer/pThr/pTyr-binding forkhead associated (FHA) protein
MMWILAADDPSVEVVTFQMPTGTVKTIGRSTGAEFIVDAPLVSRLHCQLTAGADRLHVKDLDSTNGTFVNGKRVKTAELSEGDRLSVGRLELVISRRA